MAKFIHQILISLKKIKKKKNKKPYTPCPSKFSYVKVSNLLRIPVVGSIEFSFFERGKGGKIE